MRVLQFGFDTEEDVFHRPDHFPEQSVAYTGTHDNDTLMGWFRQRKSHGNHDPLDAFIDGDRDIHLQLIKAVLDSASDTAIVPVQDLLGLGNEARMNLPGEAYGNWLWRVRASDLTDELAAVLRKMTIDAKR
jgi:4-alpha-glucanotransferase